MDLAGLCTKEQSDDGAMLQVVDFEGKETGFEILVLGPDSAEAVKMADEMQKKFIRAMSAGKDKKQDEGLSDTSVQQAVALTKDWKNGTVNGEPLVFSKEKAKWLYENAPFIKEQVLRFNGDRTRFTKPGLRNSAK